MHAKKLKDQLLNWTVNNSGLESRDYLGMSAIGRCRLALYKQMVQGRPRTTRDHLYCYLGYLFEQDILKRLAACGDGLLGPPQEFIDFGGRFKGHTDGTWGQNLLEIKSVSSDRLRHVRETRQPFKDHHWQAQCYMYYSGHRQAVIIYVARDTGDIWTFDIRRNHKLGEIARLKASEILEAVDHKRPPECECGRCDDNGRSGHIRKII